MSNWLDIAIGIILLVTVVLGLAKGFIRQIIGIATVIFGLILAVYNYAGLSGFYNRIISNSVVSHFLGFLTIFLAVLLAGGLLSHLLAKVIKGPFKLFDRLLGAVLGLLKGILICAVLVFALLVFPISKSVIRDSQLAPVCIGVAKAVIYLIPQDLKEKFREKSREVTRKVKEDGKEI